ncbi:MAG: hypothetical protein AAGI68_13250 [Planctomycetota bacterium]
MLEQIAKVSATLPCADTQPGKIANHLWIPWRVLKSSFVLFASFGVSAGGLEDQAEVVTRLGVVGISLMAYWNSHAAR